MLEELRVKSFGIITDTSLELSRGLNVLTGETGAGKTLVIGALQMLFGAKQDYKNSNDKDTLIEGRFSLDKEAVVVLSEARASDAVAEGRSPDDGGDSDVFEDEYVLRRHISEGKKSRFYINGAMATAREITEMGDIFIEIFGQHEQIHLMKTSAQRAALDRYAGISLEELQGLSLELRKLDKELLELGGDKDSLEAEKDFLEFQLAEIKALRIVFEDEDEALRSDEEFLASVGELKAAASQALRLLKGSGSFEGADDRLANALVSLESKDYFDSIVRRLKNCLTELVDLTGELRMAAEGLEDDPERLESVRVRRNDLHRVIRKYGHTLADVLKKQNELELKLESIAGYEEKRAQLLEKQQELILQKQHIEKTIGDARRNSAPRLAKEIEARLGELNLAGASFEVRLDDSPFAGNVEFFMAPNPGSPAVSVAKAASGGELSRVMLALKVVMSEGAFTYVFDEIDAGIGGATALAVGKMLAALAGDRQVIVVTHLAQVAAFADRHFVVEKSSDVDKTATLVREVKDDDLLAELARMLSGQPKSEIALSHARELREKAFLMK